MVEASSAEPPSDGELAENSVGQRRFAGRLGEPQRGRENTTSGDIRGFGICAYLGRANEPPCTPPGNLEINNPSSVAASDMLMRWAFSFRACGGPGAEMDDGSLGTRLTARRVFGKGAFRSARPHLRPETAAAGKCFVDHAAQ